MLDMYVPTFTFYSILANNFHLIPNFSYSLHAFFHVAVTLGFFDDIFIPEASLQHPSRFDEGEQVWVWEYQGEDSKHDLFMDVGKYLPKYSRLIYFRHFSVLL